MGRYARITEQASYAVQGEETAIVVFMETVNGAHITEHEHLVAALDHIRDNNNSHTGDFLRWTIAPVEDPQGPFHALCIWCGSQVYSETGHAGQWLTSSLLGKPGSSLCPASDNQHFHQPRQVSAHPVRQDDEAVCQEAYLAALLMAKKGSETATQEAQRIRQDLRSRGWKVPTT